MNYQLQPLPSILIQTYPILSYPPASSPFSPVVLGRRAFPEVFGMFGLGGLEDGFPGLSSPPPPFGGNGGGGGDSER